MDISEVYGFESLDSLESYLTAIPDRDRLIDQLGRDLTPALKILGVR